LVQGRTINYREAGDVPAPVVLIPHRLPGSSAEYHAALQFGRVLSPSAEWEAAFRTQTLPGRAGESHNLVVKRGGRRREIREIV
jgi:hypothetical protein